MKKFSKVVILLTIALLALTGCGNKGAEPVEINEDTEKCELCNMAVKDDQFATEILLENGKAVVFDDIGCMVKWEKGNSDKKIEDKFVRDFDSKEWIEMEKATYVFDKEVKTPMGYNVISFTNKKDAEKFVETTGGELLTFEDLQKHEWKMNKMMMKMKGHKHEENEGMEMNNDGH